jgi:hypothetical protein
MGQRAAVWLAGGLLALGLGGCGSGEEPPAGETGAKTPVSTPSAVVTNETTPVDTGETGKDDMRAKISAGLSAISPASADLVADETTRLDPVPAQWLRGWRVYDVQGLAPSHPQRFYVALSGGGSVLLLSGRPESFARMARDAGVVVDTADVALGVAELYLDSTRTFAAYSYRIKSVADIDWLPKPTAEEKRQREEITAEYAGRVGPPAAKPAAAGWTVTSWMVDDRSLVRHRLTVGADGAVQDQRQVVIREMPVPWSV